MDISKTLIYLRTRAGLTQSELAERAHISQGYLSQLESVPGKAVSAEKLYRIANVLDTSMVTFFLSMNYCQRCGVTIESNENVGVFKARKATISVGMVCNICADEYQEIIRRHDKEILNWVNMRD